MLWMRWGSKNMCSVRVRPMPSAPKFPRDLGVAGGVGVGADLEGAVLVGLQTMPNGPVISGSTVGIWPSMTSPVVPSMER